MMLSEPGPPESIVLPLGPPSALRRVDGGGHAWRYSVTAAWSGAVF